MSARIFFDGLGPPRVAVELPGTVPDGVAVDERGGLWIAC